MRKISVEETHGKFFKKNICDTGKGRKEMEYREQANDEVTIDLGALFSALLDKIVIIILSGVVVACVAFLGTKLFITPTYDSTTKIYVVSQSNSNGNLTYSDVQLGTQLTKDYMEMVKSRTVVESVIAELGLDISYEEMCDKISVANTTDTRIMAITVSDENPKMAQDMANSLRVAVSEQIREVMRVDEVNVVDEANLPEKPSRPSAIKNFVIGGVVGVFVAVAIVVLIFVIDDRIKTQEDVEKYLQLSVLGTIPLVEEKGKKKTMKKSTEKKR